MDSKNVIAAISLSAAVIILYSLFFQPDPATIKQNLVEQKKIENNADTPSIDKNENFAKLSRTDALKENDRISLGSVGKLFPLNKNTQYTYKFIGFKKELSLTLNVN